MENCSTKNYKKYNISFFFPAFNDEGTVEKMVKDGIRVLDEVAKDYEILIINDGSVDNTGEVADRMAKQYEKVRVIHHPYNIGYGGALKTGFLSSKYELIFYTDGDNQFDIEELKLLMPYIDEYDMVAGYRKTRAYSNRKAREWSSKLYNLFVKIIFGLKYKDLDCAFKLMHKDVLQKSATFINSAFICAGMMYETKKANKKIKQVPVSHYKRQYGSSSSFNLLFILRSIVELFEAMWELKYKEKYYRLRQKKLRDKIKNVK